jgi:hypothetical protein
MSITHSTNWVTADRGLVHIGDRITVLPGRTRATITGIEHQHPYRAVARLDTGAEVALWPSQMLARPG